MAACGRNCCKPFPSEWRFCSAFPLRVHFSHFSARPRMSVFADSKCVRPRRASSEHVWEVLSHHLSVQCRCDSCRDTAWQPEMLDFGHFFTRERACRPPNLRFGRFQACVTLGHPIRTRLASFITSHSCVVAPHQSERTCLIFHFLRFLVRFFC